MKRRFISLMTAISILMGTVSAMPVLASYSADADTGTYIWDFAEFTGDKEKVGQSGIQTYEYEGLTINIGNTNDRINTTGVVWSGGGGVGESNRHIVYTPTQDGTLYVTGTMSTKNERWGIADSSGSLLAENSTQATTETTVTRALTAKQTYYIYARNSAKLTVSNVRYVTASGTIETPDPNATEEPADPTPNPEDMVMSIVEDTAENSTEIDTYFLYRDANVTQFAVTTADNNGKIISQSKVAAANSITVDTTGAARVEVVPVFRYNNIGSVQTEKTLRTEVENGLYNFTFKKGGTARSDIFVNGAMVANNVDKDGYNRSKISDGSTISVNDIAVSDNSIRVQIKDTGNNAAYNMTWCEFYKAPSIAERVPKIYVIGDSLVANYYGTPKSSINIAQTGWGQVIGNYFTDAVEVVNLANGGHYATILETTAFPGVIANAKPGDYLIIESGYNDTKHNTADETRESVERMVTAAKAKGIIPVVVSPNASLADGEDNNYVESIRYTEAMRQAALNTSAYFVDLSKGSYDFYRENYGDDTDAIKNTYYFPTEKTPDLLHHNYLGAMNCARIVAQGMYDLGIKDFINTEYEFSFTDAADKEITLKIDTTKTDDPSPSPSSEPSPTPSDNPAEGIKATVKNSDGKYTVTAEAGSKQGTVIAAAYNKGVLTALQSKAYTGQPVNIDLTPAGGADRIKVMLWNSLEDMEPLYPAVELKVENTQPTTPTELVATPEPPENEAEVMNLAGEWGLKLASYSDGITTDDTCKLPGTLSENSKGKQNNSTDKTKLSLKYTYTGDATYQKKITIPADWADKSVTLSMERTKLTRVWVNGTEETDCNTSNSIAVPHEYYLKNLVPGQENTITVQVTNGTGSNESKSDNVYGLFRSKTHMLTAETQTDWNGIIGEIELKATDKIYIKDVMVYPDVKDSQAKVKVVVQNDTGAAASGKITLGAESYNHSGAADTVDPMVNNSNFAVGESTLEFTYNMGDNPKLWSEFHPALYRMAVSLEAGSIKSDYSESFGMRDWGTKEGQFTINGNKTFLRGEANSAVFPENGYPYMTKAEWITFFKKAQSMGINFFRFHSWIPPMAAFEAADELGIYMQPEMYGFGGTPTDNDFNNTLYGQDGINAVKYLASNPSFVMMTFGNEMNTTSAPVEAFRAKIRAVDPTRLYAEGTNNNLSKSEINTNDDFWTTAKVGLNGHDQQIRLSFAWNNDAEGGRLEGEQPNSEQTFDKAIAYLNSDTPVMGHETGQYQVLPKFDQEIARYDNTVFAPRNLSNFKSIMNNKGLLYMNEKFSEATARTSAIQYRADIEAAIKTNGFGGYQLLSIQDFPGQNTALVGILDSFMIDKDGGFTSAEYKSFNSPVTTLAKIPKYMYNTTDAFTAEAVIANYSENAINEIAAKWSIKDENGAVIKEGTLTSVNAPQGQVTLLGTINEATAFAEITKAQKLTFTVSAAGSENSYSLWVYPEKTETKPDDLLIADAYTKEVRDTLEAGGKVLMIPTPDTTNLPNSVSVRWTNDYWSSMFHGRVAGAATTMGLYMDTANPVFNDFPTESFSDYQWYNLMKNSRAVILDDAGSDFEPIVWNIDHMAYSRKLGSIFEAKVGDGKLLVCTMDVLHQMDKYPEVRQMYNSLVKYASSEDFNPAKTLTTDYLRTIFKPVINSAGTVSAYEEIGGLEYSWSDTKSAPKSQTGTDEDGGSVTNAAGGISAGDMLRYDNIQFSGNGSTTIKVSASNGSGTGDDAVIEVYLGSENGEKIATLNFANTGGWDKFETQEYTIPHMWGTKNILLKFTNANICLNYITFEESSKTYRDPYTLIDPSNTSSGAIEITDIGGTHSLEQLTVQVNGAVRFTIPNCDFGIDGAVAVKIGGSVLSGNEAKADIIYTENGERKRIPISLKMGEGEEYALESGSTGGLAFWRNKITLPSTIRGVQDIELEFAADANLHFSDITFLDKSALTNTWDFAKYTGDAAVTATEDKTVNYEGLEIHLAADDTVTTGGIVWNSPKTTTSNSNTSTINRYIKYTPSNDGTLTLTFQGNQWNSSSKAPRIYIVTSEADMNKNAGDAAKMSATATAKDKDTTLTASLTAGTTYYIWPYYYGSSACVFTVSDIVFIPSDKPDIIEQPSETEKPQQTEQPSETEKPQETEKPSETEKPAEEPKNIVETYKFDFGTDTAAEGYTAVTPDMVYDMSASDAAAEGEMFGFLGTTDESYANDILPYNCDNRAIDGFSLVKGQKIALSSGGTASENDADSDYIAVPKQTGYLPAAASSYEGRFPIRFSMKADRQSYYTVTATLTNSSETENASVSLFSEKRQIVAENVTIKPHEKVTFKFSVDIEDVYYKVYSTSFTDDMLNISVSGENAALSSLIVEKHAKKAGKIKGTASDSVNDGVTLWACTDSTGCDCPATVPFFALQNYAGVGQALIKYMPENIAVSNQGERGLSTIDNTHFGKCNLKEGDYLYVEYGHNDTNADTYKTNLEKYYTRAHESGAKLIIVSAINRHNSWDGTEWKSNFTSYIEAAQSFTKEKIDAGADDIAFVDLNTPYVAWMNTETARIKAINPALDEQGAMSFYYRSVKGQKVDGTHMNDAGADQGAYAFFTAAKAIVDAADNGSTDKYILAQAEIVRPLVEGMKTKVGNSETDNLPMMVSDDIINAGKAPNSYWDTVPSDAIEYVHSASVDGVGAVTENDGSVTISSVSMRIMNPSITYAKAIVTVKDNGTETKYYTEKNYDCTGDEAGTVHTNSGFITSDKAYADVTESDKTAAITVPAGADCTVQIVECDEGTWLVGSNPAVYSAVYNVYPETASVFTDGIAALEEGNEVWDTTGVDGWGILSGASEYGAIVNSEGDGDEAEKYISLTSSGTDSGGTKKNYGFFKKLGTPISDGRYRLSFKTRWDSGVARFTLSKDVGNASNPFPNKTYLLGITASGGVYTANNENNILPITINDDDNTKTNSKINPAQWINVDCIINFKTGKIAVSAAGSDYAEYAIGDWRSLSPGTVPINYFGVAGSGDGTATAVDIKDIEIVKLTDAAGESYTVSASCDTGKGSVAINGESAASKTIAEGEQVTFKAVAKSGYKFASWTDAEGSVLSQSAEYTTRIFENITVTANFEELASNETVWNFSEYADENAVSGAKVTANQETENVDYNGLKIHLNENDTVTENGVYWSIPSHKTNAVVSNNRFITYTPSANGTISISFKGSAYVSNRKPRMYIVEGESTSVMKKAGKNVEATAANKDTVLTETLTAGKTYYIYSFFNNTDGCAFTISSITFTEE